MEADVHRDVQLAEWSEDNTEWPGDDTATGDAVLITSILCHPLPKALHLAIRTMAAGKEFQARTTT